MYKYIVLDLDNTLTNETSSRKSGFKKVLEYLNRPYDEDEFKRFVSFDKEYWNDIRNNVILTPAKYLLTHELHKTWNRATRFIRFFDELNLSVEQGSKINDIYIIGLGEDVELIEYAKELLEYLKNKDYTLIMATDGPKLAQNPKLDNGHIREYFSDVIISEEISSSKGEIDFFNTIMTRNNIENPNEVVFIGDSLVGDIKFSNVVGFTTIWYNIDKLPTNNDIIPSYTVSSLQEILNIL